MPAKFALIAIIFTVQGESAPTFTTATSLFPASACESEKNKIVEELKAPKIGSKAIAEASGQCHPLSDDDLEKLLKSLETAKASDFAQNHFRTTAFSFFERADLMVIPSLALEEPSLCEKKGQMISDRMKSTRLEVGVIKEVSFNCVPLTRREANAIIVKGRAEQPAR